MELLEKHLGIGFLQESIQDYKDLFLSPISKVTQVQSGSPAKATAERESKPSASKKEVKQVIMFKAETMEKVETQDFRKYTNQLLAPYFLQIQTIFSQQNMENIQFRNCLAKFDQDSCALDQACIYEYQI